MNSYTPPQSSPAKLQSKSSPVKRARKITLPLIAVLWATGSVFGSIVGPYTPDANTLYLFHLDESAGASTAVNASGSLAFGTNAISYDGNPLVADGLTQPTVTTVLGASAFPGFGNSASLSAGTDLGLGVDRDLSGTFGQGDNSPVAADQFPDHTTIFGAGNAFTVEAVIKVSTITSGNQQIVCTDNNAATADRGLIFRINGSGQLEWNFVGSSSTLTVAIPTSGVHAFNSNAWFHVAAAYDGANVSLYWTRMNSDFTSANLLTSAARTVDINDDAIIVIGNEGRAASGEGLKGQIDEVRISNVARAAGQFVFGSNPDPYAGTATLSTNGPVYPGTTVTVSATGTTGTAPLTYFWQTDNGTGWTDLPGSTTNTYALNTLVLANTTNQYRLVVTNTLGSSTGAVATLIVLPNTAPTLTANTIITPPTVGLGFAATMSASFVGNLPLYYQWQYTNNNGGSLVNIPGATSASLTITSAQFSDAGAYRLVASNAVAGGSVSNSSFATLAVRPAVILASAGTTAPTPNDGDDISQFGENSAVNPTGLNYYSDNGNPPGQIFTTGTNSGGYSLAALYVRWFSDGGHAAGNPWTLRLYSLVSTNSTTATLIGEYQNDNAAPAIDDTWTKWYGNITNILSPNSVYAYTIRARNAAGTAGGGFLEMGSVNGNPYGGGQAVGIDEDGDPVQLTATDFDATFMLDLVPSGYPAVQTVSISPANSPALPLYGGQPVMLSVQAIGAAPLHYQWQTDNGTGGASFSDLSGSDTNSHTFDTTSLPAGTYQYQVIVTNSFASATSSAVTLNLLAASAPVLTTNTIITPPAAFVGNSVQMRAAFSGTPPISYQWKFDSGSGPVAIAGATNATHNIASAQLANSGAYFLTASNGISPYTASSDPALLTVAQIPQTNTISAIILDAGSSPPPVGGYDIAQLVSAPPTLVPGLNYYVDSSAPPGQTFTTGTNPPSAAGYPLNSVWLQEELSTVGSGGDTPQTYTLGIYSVSGSNVALVTAYTSTNTLAITEGNWVLWTGMTNVLRTNSTYAFSIKRNGNGWWKVANNSTATDLYDGGQAVALPASGAGSLIFSTDTTIDAAFLIGLTPPSAPIVLQDTTITPSHCYAGNPATVRAVFAGLLPIRYQWQFTDTNGAGPVNLPGATNNTYTVASVGPANAGTYSLVASNFYGGVPNLTTSTPALLTLQPAPAYFVANFAWSDPYSGAGAFPSGTFWNKIDSSGRNQTGLGDDGSTDLYLGFTSSRTWQFYSGGGIPLFAPYMLNQGNTALPFAVNNLPAGAYQLILYAANGHYRFSRTSFTIGGTTQSANTTADEWFAEGDNYVVFTNLVVTNGTISGTWQRGTAEAAFNGFQVVLGYSFENPAINIAIQPSNTVAAVGQQASLSVLAFGPPPLRYQWRASGTAISSATNSTLAFPAVTLANGIPSYDVVITNLSGMAITSSVATLTVRSTVDSLLWRGYTSDWDFASGNWQNTVSLADPVPFQPGDSVLFDDTTPTLRVILAGRLMPGSVTVNTSTNYDFTGAGSLSGGMGLNLTGGLTLRRPHDYTGNTVLSPGATLALSGAGAIGGSANIVLGAGATLNANARTDATLTVNSSQTLKGDGAFNVTGTVITSGTLEFKVSKASGVITSDLLQGMTSITYGGNLALVHSGEALAAGNAIKLFTATTYLGAFTTITPATPGTGLLWNTSTLASDGTLRVANAINLAPTNITTSVSGNQMTLSWPTDHTGWTLKTNSVSIADINAWFDYPPGTGSRDTNQAVITVNPTKANVFFRLTYP